MAYYRRGWPCCFLPARWRYPGAINRRVARALLAAAIIVTVLFLFQPAPPITRPAMMPPPASKAPPATPPPPPSPPPPPAGRRPQVPSAASSRLDIQFKPASFDWTTVTQRYPVSSIRPLPSAPPRPLGRVQHAFDDYVHDATTSKRQETVRAAFLKSWRSYKKQAWLHDELAPVTGGGKTTFGGWAATIVDSLDTLWIMGLEDEFRDAAAAAAQIDWANTTDTAANLFETTIRHLGGLVSAYDLSREPALLDKAEELGNMLYAAFDTPNRMPNFWFNFDDARRGRQLAGTNDPSASPCSLSLEFTRLALLTGDAKFYDAVARITDFLERTQHQSRLPGLWPKLINFRDQAVDGQTAFTLGALADSLYEYLPKMSALLGGQPPEYERMYRTAMDAATEHLLFRPMVADDDDEGQRVLFVGDAVAHAPDRVERVPDGQHLSCFAGGMFALGGRLFDIPAHVAFGDRLARGCAWAYKVFPTGIMPEIFRAVACDSVDGPCPFDLQRWEDEGGAGRGMPKGFKTASDTRYILRPEAIESIFLMYRITGNSEYRELAWRMFEAVAKATETDLAYSAIADVTVSGETTKTDSMESFFFAETLKYFYLIFSPPDLISLDEFVLNTEAHPFRRAL